MPYSPKEAIAFLDKHYQAICELMRLTREGEELFTQELINKLQEHPEHPLPKLEDLLKLTLLEKGAAGQGHYFVHTGYRRFFSFLSNHFSLKLPERLAKYQYALKNLKDRLEKTARQPLEAIEVARNLREEIPDLRRGGAHAYQSPAPSSRCAQKCPW